MSHTPCGEDAFEAMFPHSELSCDTCAHRADNLLMWPLQGVCLGSDGYRWLALVASGMAGERNNATIHAGYRAATSDEIAYGDIPS